MVTQMFWVVVLIVGLITVGAITYLLVENDPAPYTEADTTLEILFGVIDASVSCVELENALEIAVAEGLDHLHDSQIDQAEIMLDLAERSAARRQAIGCTSEDS